MVDMAHDTDDRRAVRHLGLVILSLGEQRADDVFSLFLLADDIVLERDFLSLLVGKLMIKRDHLALHEEFFDDLGSRNMHLFGEIANRDSLRDADLRDDDLILFLRRLRRFVLECFWHAVELLSAALAASACRLAAAAVPELPSLFAESLAILSVLAEISRRLVGERTVSGCGSGSSAAAALEGTALAGSWGTASDSGCASACRTLSGATGAVGSVTAAPRARCSASLRALAVG